MERELAQLKARVAQLEATVRQFIEPVLAPESLPPSETPLNETELLAWLKAEGLLRDPTPEERRLAAEWDALPESEKQAHINFMRSLRLDPPLSQIIIDNRR
jgi:hypothetical protein